MRIEEVIGRRVREAREARAMTQEEFGELLAALLGRQWPRQAVSAAEKGQRSFAAAELIAFSVALGCDVADLFRLPADVDALSMPSGNALTREQLRQASEASMPSAQELRQALSELVKAAGSMQMAGFVTEQRAKRLYDELDRVLVDLERRS